MTVKTGDYMIVFDPVIWGGKDKGNNEHCWRRAIILHVDGGTADVRFLHDGRFSRGHFIDAMRTP